MRLIIEFNKQDMKRLNLNNLMAILKRFNQGDTEAYFKRRGDEMLQIVISRKHTLKDLCKDLGIPHFESREELVRWLSERRKHGRSRRKVSSN